MLFCDTAKSWMVACTLTIQLQVGNTSMIIQENVVHYYDCVWCFISAHNNLRSLVFFQTFSKRFLEFNPFPLVRVVSRFIVYTHRTARALYNFIFIYLLAARATHSHTLTLVSVTKVLLCRSYNYRLTATFG